MRDRRGLVDAWPNVPATSQGDNARSGLSDGSTAEPQSSETMFDELVSA
jgi:hypothetical protein